MLKFFVILLLPNLVNAQEDVLEFNYKSEKCGRKFDNCFLGIDQQLNAHLDFGGAIQKLVKADQGVLCGELQITFVCTQLSDCYGDDDFSLSTIDDFILMACNEGQSLIQKTKTCLVENSQFQSCFDKNNIDTSKKDCGEVKKAHKCLSEQTCLIEEDWKLLYKHTYQSHADVLEECQIGNTGSTFGCNVASLERCLKGLTYALENFYDFGPYENNKQYCQSYASSSGCFEELGCSLTDTADVINYKRNKDALDILCSNYNENVDTWRVKCSGLPTNVFNFDTDTVSKSQYCSYVKNKITLLQTNKEGCTYKDVLTSAIKVNYEDYLKAMKIDNCEL